ncbi:hypothetical protein CEXT_406221 [Caerostris extrusa]|uniref:Uncharacterized protein n=1 Tax=Caerostris extrusa TaxID=172846 RepID=A0AAV4MEZ9_CAEEX|nr:hypothetical protein CEXT_406221 [Caerostris extrusa]
MKTTEINGSTNPFKSFFVIDNNPKMFTSTAPCSALPPPTHHFSNTRFSSHQHVQKRPTPQGFKCQHGEGLHTPKANDNFQRQTKDALPPALPQD